MGLELGTLTLEYTKIFTKQFKLPHKYLIFVNCLLVTLSTRINSSLLINGSIWYLIFNNLCNTYVFSHSPKLGQVSLSTRMTVQPVDMS